MGYLIVVMRINLGKSKLKRAFIADDFLISNPRKSTTFVI